LLALTVASITGLLFHSLVGQRLWQLPIYWALSIAGFLAGEVTSGLAGHALLRIGTVPVAEGLVGALLALGVGWLLTTPAPSPSRRRVSETRRIVVLRQRRVPGD
jgi:hypothetical protein